jgi:HEAT repeat protein
MRTPLSLAARLGALGRPEDRPVREQLILESLADRAAPVRDVAVAWAARCLEPARLVPLVAEAADDVLRNAALAALERQGPYAVDCVEGLVTDPDPDLAMFSCQVLGGIGGAGSTGPLLAALARPEVNVVQAAAEALGRLQARDAVPALIKLLSREPWLQLAASDALGAIGDPAAVGPLLALVPDAMIAEAALGALARIGSPDALPKLFPLLLDPRHVRLRDALLYAVSGALVAAEASDACRVIGRSIEADHAAGGLWQYLADGLASARTAADAPAPSFGLRPDDRGSERGGHATVRAAGTLVLATEVGSLLPLVVRWAAAPAGAAWVRPLVQRYELSGREAWWTLLSHPDAEVRAGCVRVTSPALIGHERLLAALADREVVVRIAAAEALGDLRDERAASALERLLDAETPAERHAVVQALAALPDILDAVLAPRLGADTPTAAQLPALAVLANVHVPGLDARVLELAGSETAAVRKLALRAAARVPGSKAEVLLLRALADRDQAQQVEALDLLVARGGDRVLTTLLALLGVADSLRYHVIRALGRLGNARAAAPLESLFAGAPLHEQLEILDALPRLAAVPSRPFLLNCLDHQRAEVRHAAAHALADLAEAGDAEVLARLAADPDWVMRSEAARAFGRLGISEGRRTLLDLVRDLEPAVARTARAALAGRP